MKGMTETEDRYIIRRQKCIVSCSKNLGVPQISDIGNASNMRWENGAFVLIVEDRLVDFKYPTGTEGWIDVTRQSDTVTLGSANAEATWMQPVPSISATDVVPA
jgi:hypothetical protein